MSAAVMQQKSRVLRNVTGTMVQSLVKKQGGMGKKKTKFLFSNQFWNDFTSCLPGCVKAV